MLNQQRIIVAFHKGEKSKGVGAWLVSAMCKVFTNSDYRHGRKRGINKSRYAHTEVIFPVSVAGDKNSFSSRGTADPSGVSFKEIKYSHPDRWDFVDVDWIDSFEGIESAYRVACTLTGKKYAYNNVFNTFGFFRTKKDRKGAEDWWCSEVDAYVIGIPEYKVSPNKLFTEVCLRNAEYHKGKR